MMTNNATSTTVWTISISSCLKSYAGVVALTWLGRSTLSDRTEHSTKRSLQSSGVTLLLNMTLVDLAYTWSKPHRSPARLCGAFYIVTNRNQYYPSPSDNSLNLAAIVALPRVSFLIERSSALLFARRRLFSEDSSASLVF